MSKVGEGHLHRGKPKQVIHFKINIQLNLHETNQLFRYLSHDLIWHSSSIYEDFVQIWTGMSFCFFRNNHTKNTECISEKEPCYSADCFGTFIKIHSKKPNL